MPISEYLCNDCGHLFEEFYTPEEWRAGVPDKTACPHCQTVTAQKLPALYGGYGMNSGGASTRPKGAGSFKGRKV